MTKLFFSVLVVILGSTLAAAPKDKEEPKTKVVRNAEYNRQVLQARVNLEFNDAKIDDVIDKLSKDHRANFVFDKAEFERSMEKERGITVKLEDVLLGSGIQTIFSSYQMAPFIIGDTILITNKTTGKSRQLDQMIFIDFDNVPLSRALAELSRSYSVPINLDPKTKEGGRSETPISGIYGNVALSIVIEMLAAKAQLRPHYIENQVYVTLPRPPEERVRFLVGALDKRIEDVAKGEVALPFLLELLSDLASQPGGDRNPELKVPLLLDVEAFRKQTQGMFDPERVQIRFSTKFVNTPLSEILRIIGDQLDGVAMVRKDFIEFIPKPLACHELKIKLGEDEPFPTLVHCFHTKTPLEKALQQISETYNQNVVLSRLADAKKDFPITARIVNVPLESAVETLAAMADLHVVRKANVLYVTTKEQAQEMIAEQKRKEREEKPLMPEKKEEKKEEPTP